MTVKVISYYMYLSYYFIEVEVLFKQKWRPFRQGFPELKKRITENLGFYHIQKFFEFEEVHVLWKVQKRLEAI